MSHKQMLYGCPFIKDFYTFAFVRNPWDRCVSWYCSIANIDRPANTSHGVPPEHKGIFIDQIKNTLLSATQTEFIDPGVSFIGRFENLEADYRKVSDHLGLPYLLMHENPSEHAHYRDYYDDETREMVAEHYKSDIEAFGYTF